MASRSKASEPGPTRSNRVNQILSGPWDDPGWLIENYCRKRQFTDDDPETIIFAWLIVLGSRTAPSVAARSLLVRFGKLNPPEDCSPSADILRRLADIARGRSAVHARR
ncbi:MAG: hypothetical protein AAGA09_02580 [Pseudomonadota bacterium]